jgi:hypothetical protein
MTDLAHARGDELLSMLRSPVTPEPMVGHWHNTDVTSRGISEVTCSVRDGDLYVAVRGAGPDGPIEWGEVPAEVYADISVTGGARSTVDPADTHYADISATGGGPAFLAVYDHGFMRVYLQGRLNLGILPLAIFTEFVDGSGRSNYYTREILVR